MIDRTKETYQQYRERARELYTRCAVAHGEHFGDANYVHDSVTIPLHACVQVCDDGAFVEATVWVPRDKLQRPAPQPTAAEITAFAAFVTAGRHVTCPQCNGYRVYVNGVRCERCNGHGVVSVDEGME